MKVEKQEVPAGDFTPFRLVIDVESKEEAQALYAIFNYGPNCDILRGSAYTIRKTIGEEHYRSDNEEIIPGLKARQFYVPKQK